MLKFLPQPWFIPVPFILALSSPLAATEKAIAQVLPSAESEHLPSLPTAQQSVAFVSRARAYRYATPVNLYPGRSVMIDFRTDEVITYIQLSDLSEIVYQTNAPVDSGQAKLITLRRIEDLTFPGQTEAAVPNLLVTTVDAAGEQRTYTFNLVLLSRQPRLADINGVAIVPAAEAQAERLNLLRNEGELVEDPLTVDTLQTSLGQADVDDLARGLDRAIALGYTPADDPVVAQTQAVIELVQFDIPLRQAIREVGLPLDVAISLGEIGLENEPLPTVEEILPEPADLQIVPPPASSEELLPDDGPAVDDIVDEEDETDAPI